MAEIKQATFTRAVRGDAKATKGSEPTIEPVVKGISSVGRAAVRRVHKESAALAVSYFAGKISKFLLMSGRPASTAETYRRSLEQYIEWDAGTEATADLDVSRPVPVGSDHIRARAHVVIEDDDGDREVRVLLWDELPLDEGQAEMIALPVLDCVNAEYAAGSTQSVEVWQLACGQRYSVAPATAEERREAVEELVANL
ncbi:MAG: hypothetical protein QM729_09970 [Solirubrobacterales bacterium]